MSERDGLHAVELKLDEGQLVVRVICGWKMDDESRPCWSRLTDGSLDPDGASYCNYREWQENMDGGVLSNTMLGVWPVSARWESYDCLWLDLEPRP